MNSTPSSLTVTDARGNAHTVLAAKRFSSYLVLVVHSWPSRSTPYVVHTFNEQDGGFGHGHYCDSLARALEVFDADKRANTYAAL